MKGENIRPAPPPKARQKFITKPGLLNFEIPFDFF